VIQKLSTETQESSQIMKKNEPYLQQRVYKVHISSGKLVYTALSHSWKLTSTTVLYLVCSVLV